MHTRTTTAALLLAAGLALTACSGSNDEKPTATAATPAATTAPAPAYDAAAWKTRIQNLIGQLDKAQPGCTAQPSSEACANALLAADQTILAMNRDLTSGGIANYPATVDHVGKILTGYNAYVSGNCAGSPLADEQGSDCRTAMATVLLGVATLPAKMTLDGAS